MRQKLSVTMHNATKLKSVTNRNLIWKENILSRGSCRTMTQDPNMPGICMIVVYYNLFIIIIIIITCYCFIGQVYSLTSLFLCYLVGIEYIRILDSWLLQDSWSLASFLNFFLLNLALRMSHNYIHTFYKFILVEQLQMVGWEVSDN